MSDKNELPESNEATPSILSADGQPLQDENLAERAKERQLESSNYVSVIVKRTDETFRHPDDILEKAIEEGLAQLSRPNLSLMLSSIAAGMIICFTVMAVGVMTSIVGDLSTGFNKVMVALVYPLGFVLCILSRTQLFTEHTATAFYPILDKRAGIGMMMKQIGRASCRERVCMFV